MAPAGLDLGLHLLAQGVERPGVRFVAVRHVGRVVEGLPHLLGRGPPDAAQGDPLQVPVEIVLGLDLDRGLLSGRDRPGGADVVLGDASVRARAPDGGDVDAELSGQRPDLGRGQDLARPGPGGGAGRCRLRARAAGAGAATALRGSARSARLSPFSPIVTSAWPTLTRSFSLKWSLRTVPAYGDGISTMALSVSISARAGRPGPRRPP